METNNWELIKSKQWQNRISVRENGEQIFVIEHYYKDIEYMDAIEERITECVNGYDALLEENKRLKDALHMAHNCLKATYGDEFKHWIENDAIESALNLSTVK